MPRVYVFRIVLSKHCMHVILPGTCDLLPLLLMYVCIFLYTLHACLTTMKVNLIHSRVPCSLIFIYDRCTFTRKRSVTGIFPVSYALLSNHGRGQRRYWLPPIDEWQFCSHYILINIPRELNIPHIGSDLLFGKMNPNSQRLELPTPDDYTFISDFPSSWHIH